MIFSENRYLRFGIKLSLADAQSITNPHKTTAAVACRAGRRLNKADHSARAKSWLSAPFHHGEIAVRE
jgi:hypothetical protein